MVACFNFTVKKKKLARFKRCMLTPVSAFSLAIHPTLSHPLLRTYLMLANTGTPIPGLLYSSVQRREREQKKQKRAKGREEGGGEGDGGNERERIETYCRQEMNFYDIYFKSFFHRGRYPLPRRVPSAKNQDPSSLFRERPGRWDVLWDKLLAID